MSFSGEVKDELVRLLPEARHCDIAELAAILEYTKAVKCDEKGAKYIEIQEETPYVARKGFTLLKKTFNIEGKMDNFVKSVPIHGRRRCAENIAGGEVRGEELMCQSSGHQKPVL